MRVRGLEHHLCFFILLAKLEQDGVKHIRYCNMNKLGGGTKPADVIPKTCNPRTTYYM